MQQLTQKPEQFRERLNRGAFQKGKERKGKERTVKERKRKDRKGKGTISLPVFPGFQLLIASSNPT